MNYSLTVDSLIFPIAQYITNNQWRLPWNGRLLPVRICREGTPLAGTILAKPVVAWFDTQLIGTMTLPEFTNRFPEALGNQKNENQGEPVCATVHYQQPTPGVWPNGFPHDNLRVSVNS